jgi:hypothetical protein
MLSGYFLPLINHAFEFFPSKEWLFLLTKETQVDFVEMN